MNEEIRNNEINENELEQVSGGSGSSAPADNSCPDCGGALTLMSYVTYEGSYEQRSIYCCTQCRNIVRRLEKRDTPFKRF